MIIQYGLIVQFACALCQIRAHPPERWYEVIKAYISRRYAHLPQIFGSNSPGVFL